MEFSKLNTKKAAERGAFLHLKHPATGTPLWSGEGQARAKVGVIVRGMESATVQARLKALTRAGMTNPSEEEGLEFVSSLIIGFVEVERDGVPIGSSEEEILWFLNLSGNFVEQIGAFARDRSNFFANVETA